MLPLLFNGDHGWTASDLQVLTEWADKQIVGCRHVI